MTKPLLILFTALFLACGASVSNAKIIWHWQDQFAVTEQRKLQRWVETTVAGVEGLVGEYPFDVHIYFYSLQASEPVPWANTSRSYQQAVNFHVSANYSLHHFLNDWTGAHELSHLIIPYVGERYAWFAEGFASFMQYQVMHKMGQLSAQQLQQKYRYHINKARESYRSDHLPFAIAAPILRAEGQYPTMYWGGAMYFLKVDQALKRQGKSFIEILRAYVDCCRLRSGNVHTLVSEWDRLSGTQLFSDQLETMKSKPGFPSIDD